MAEFRLRNSKGLFLDLRSNGVMTEVVYRHLRDIHAPGIQDPKIRAKCLEALDCVAELPLMEDYMPLCSLDHVLASGSASSRRESMGWASAYGWLRPGAARGASSNSGVTARSAKEAGWEAIQRVEKVKSTLNKMLIEAGASALEPSAFGGLSGLKKTMESLVFEPVDENQERAGCEACALFVGSNPPGYLDSKGRVGPLARARMFESAEAAGRTARSQGVSNWKAVGVAMSVTRQFDVTGDSPQEALSAVIAQREAEELNLALEAAGVERLKKKLEELMARVAPEGEAEAPRPRSRL